MTKQTMYVIIAIGIFSVIGFLKAGDAKPNLVPPPPTGYGIKLPDDLSLRDRFALAYAQQGAGFSSPDNPYDVADRVLKGR